MCGITSQLSPLPVVRFAWKTKRSNRHFLLVQIPAAANRLFAAAMSLWRRPGERTIGVAGWPRLAVDTSRKNCRNVDSVTHGVAPTFDVGSTTPAQPRVVHRHKVAKFNREPPRRLGSQGSFGTSRNGIKGSEGSEIINAHIRRSIF